MGGKWCVRSIYLSVDIIGKTAISFRAKKFPSIDVISKAAIAFRGRKNRNCEIDRLG